jgi:hypothetical protein
MPEAKKKLETKHKNPVNEKEPANDGQISKKTKDGLRSASIPKYLKSEMSDNRKIFQEAKQPSSYSTSEKKVDEHYFTIKDSLTDNVFILKKSNSKSWLKTKPPSVKLEDKCLLTRKIETDKINTEKKS